MYGCIFLNEICNFSLPVQVKLLQVLQERTFFPVGSHDRQRFHGRVIAATNWPLEMMRREGQFRNDFYYRLCSDIIEMPPLRQRLAEDPGELAVPARSVLHRMFGSHCDELTESVCSSLQSCLGEAYPWPGNVRELEQAIRRILVAGTYRGEAPTGTTTADPELFRAIDGETLDAKQLLTGYCQLLYRRHGTIEAVARRTGLDRRTVRKHLPDFD